MNEDDLRIERQIAWLEHASPDDWHRMMLDFNWSERIDPLFWIVRQPDCDKATALTIFWRGQPACHLLEVVEKGGLDTRNDPVWEMLKYISQRLASEGYDRSRIAYQADAGIQQDYSELQKYERQLTRSPLKTHRAMRRPIRGREVVNDVQFYRRYPQDLHLSVLVELPDTTRLFASLGPLYEVTSLGKICHDMMISMAVALVVFDIIGVFHPFSTKMISNIHFAGVGAIAISALIFFTTSRRLVL